MLLKLIFSLFLVGGFFQNIFATTPDNPSNLINPAGASRAHVWEDNIYYFGGAAHWWGREFYNQIYTFDGNSWIILDSIPDFNSWGMGSAIDSQAVYLLDGWPGGAGLFRKYNLKTKTFDYLPKSPNTVHWGSTVQLVNENLYLFNPAGKVFRYSFSDSSWDTKSANSKTSYSLHSVLYDNEIYMVGYHDNAFYKYNPQNDQWTQLANLPYSLAGCAIEIYNDKIFCIGGSQTSGPGPTNTYKSVISYDFINDSWDYEKFHISSGRIWMSSVVLQDSIYIMGGFDSLGVAVDITEKLKPGTISEINEEENKIYAEWFSLSQNYPNPFNPITTIEYQISKTSQVDLSIYNPSGRKVANLVYNKQAPGSYKVNWDAGKYSSGVYFYRLKTDNGFVQTKKLILMK